MSTITFDTSDIATLIHNCIFLSVQRYLKVYCRMYEYFIECIFDLFKPIWS